MVALKPCPDPDPDPSASEKQERRGGIETAKIIEIIKGLECRSRNAVVALKLKNKMSPGRG